MPFGTFTFGTGAFGTTALAPISPDLCVTSCAQSNTNAILVTYGTAQPQMLDPFATNDALNPGNYTLTVLDPFDAKLPLPQWVDQVDDFTVKVWFDAPLQAGATYQLEVANVFDVDCFLIDPTCDTCTLTAFKPDPVPDAIKTEDNKSLDIANPQITSDVQQRRGQDAPLGSFQINQVGDYALDANPSYLRKRIIRRATTLRGQFFHLPGYGFGQPVKGRISPSVLRSIQGEAIRQIQQEPDVAAVAVRVRQASAQNPNILILDIRVQDTAGRSDNFTVPLDFSPGGGD